MQFPSDLGGYGSSGYPPNSGYYQANPAYPAQYGGGYADPAAGYPPTGYSDPSGYPPPATAYATREATSAGYGGYGDHTATGYPPVSGYPPSDPSGYHSNPYATNPSAGFPPATSPYGTVDHSTGYPPSTGYPVTNPYASNPSPGTPAGYPSTPAAGYPPTSSPYATNPSPGTPAGYPPSTPAAGYPPTSSPYATNPSPGAATPAGYLPASSTPAGYPLASANPYATNPGAGYPPQTASPYATNPSPGPFSAISFTDSVAWPPASTQYSIPSPTSHTAEPAVDTARLEEEIRQKIKAEEKQKDDAKQLEMEELQRQNEEAKALIQQQQKQLDDAKRKDEEAQAQAKVAASAPPAEEKSPRPTTSAPSYGQQKTDSEDPKRSKAVSKRSKSTKKSGCSDLVSATDEIEAVEDVIIPNQPTSNTRKTDSSSGKRAKGAGDDCQKGLVTTFTELSKFDLISWKKENEYYTKKIAPSSKEFRRFQSLMTTMFNFDPLIIEELTAVYNPTLTSSFQNFQKTLATRKRDAPEIFFSRKWQQHTNQKLPHSTWINDEYEKRCAMFKWNTGAELPILPVLHGTGLQIAEKICKTGFAAISSLDEGYYGKGIYFSSHGLYTIPYLCFHREPAILFCYALPGNIYPVHENKDQVDSLLGKALQSGYQSHYVLTQRNGLISAPDGKEVYDELVLNQEAQVVPAYLIKISRSNIKKLKDHWNRSTIAKQSS